jgi:hypothetical protein
LAWRGSLVDLRRCITIDVFIGDLSYRSPNKKLDDKENLSDMIKMHLLLFLLLVEHRLILTCKASIPLKAIALSLVIITNATTRAISARLVAIAIQNVGPARTFKKSA